MLKAVINPFLETSTKGAYGLEDSGGDGLDVGCEDGPPIEHHEVPGENVPAKTSMSEKTC